MTNVASLFRPRQTLPSRSTPARPRRPIDREPPAPTRYERLRPWLGFSALAALLILLFQLIGDNHRTVHDRMARGRMYGHTLQVMLVAESLRGRFSQALESERGFLLTEEKAFVAEFDRARAEVPRLLAELDHLTDGDPHQRASIAELTTRMVEFMAFVESEIALESVGAHGIAVDRIRNGRGYVSLAEIGTLIDGIVDREKSYLAERRADLDRADQRIERSLRMIFWIGLVLLLIVAGVGLAALRAQRQAKLANHRLSLAAGTDALTGLGNRRTFFEWLDGGAHDGEGAVALVDIDHFKSVNDNFGHPAGDETLRRVASALEQAIDGEGVVARVGGEEFGILFDGRDRDSVEGACERLREAVARTRVELDGGVTLVVTLSVGLAMRAAGEGSDRLIARADQALYRAKQEGRNRVRLAA